MELFYNAIKNGLFIYNLQANHDGMDIAYFVWEYPPRLIGGLGTYAAEITKKFAEKGHHVEIFTMNSDSKLKTYEEIGKNIVVHRPIVADASNIYLVFVDEELKRWGKGFRFFSDILTYNVLAANKYVNEVAKERRCEILVSHDWLSCMAGAIAKQNLKCPFILHMHSTEHGRSGGGGSSTVKELEYTAASQADMLITVSYAMREELHALKFPAEKMRVVWNGVDEQKCSMRNFPAKKVAEYRERLGVKESEKIILFTGRLTWVKGVDSLIRAMPAIAQKVPEARLVVLGRGEQYEELVALANNLGVGKRITFINKWVEEDERLTLYAASELVVAPSRYEPFGIVALEGMAMEKPVVVGSGGLREAVIEGQHGLYCDPNNPQSIAEQCIKILTNAELAEKFGKNGRKRVEEHFTWDKIANDTLALYETLM